MKPGSDIDRALDLYSAVASGGDDEFLNMIVIPGNPANKVRPKFTKSGRAYMPKESREAEEYTRSYMRGMVEEPYTGNVALGCIFFRQSYQRIDTDNMIKHVCDSANGVLWVDDSQVTAIIAVTELDPEMPRTVIVIGRHVSTMARGTDLVRACVICGTEFTLAGKNPNTKTCSMRCTTRAKGYIPLDEPVICPQCGNPFVRASSYQKLCSPACRAARMVGTHKTRSVSMSHCADCGRELTHRRGGRCRDCWRGSLQERAKKTAEPGFVEEEGME